MKEINLYFVRHGETVWNTNELMQGSQNSPLTQQGILGAKKTGEYLHDLSFLKAYSSPQQRAIDTRDTLVAQLANPVPVATHAGFREMDFGIWEGQSIQALRATPEFAIYTNHPDKFNPIVNQGESYLQVLDRFQDAIDDIIAEQTEDKGNILIVSHGTALRLALCVLSGGDWRRHRDDNYFPRVLNTSISLVKYHQKDNEDRGRFSLEAYNQVGHLD